MWGFAPTRRALTKKQLLRRSGNEVKGAYLRGGDFRPQGENTTPLPLDVVTRITLDGRGKGTPFPPEPSAARAGFGAEPHNKV